MKINARDKWRGHRSSRFHLIGSDKLGCGINKLNPGTVMHCTGTLVEHDCLQDKMPRVEEHQREYVMGFLIFANPTRVTNRIEINVHHYK
jgi:hypothetical protein